MLAKIFVVVAICVYNVQAIDDETAELMKMLRENCVEETGVDMALIDQVNAGADLIPDPKLKCYCKCFMETAGMFSDGEVQVDSILAMLPADMKGDNEKYIISCGTQKGADDCDTAFLTQVCWQKGNKAGYILV